MHILSHRTIPSAEVVSAILCLHDELLTPGPDAEVRIVLAEMRDDVDVVALAVEWSGAGAVIIQTYAEDEDGVAEAHQYVVGRQCTRAEVRLAVNIILADVWPRLVDSMDL